MKHFALAFAILVCGQVALAGVYAIRIKQPDDQRIRWLTAADPEQGVEFEIEGGLVSVRKSVDGPNRIRIDVTGKGQPASVVIVSCGQGWAEVRIEP